MSHDLDSLFYNLVAPITYCNLIYVTLVLNYKFYKYYLFLIVNSGVPFFLKMLIVEC